MAKKFGALAEFRQTRIEELETQNAEETATMMAPKDSGRERGRGRPAGKRSNPDFEPTTVLLRKQTKRKASRLLEDTESDYDLSELIEALLLKWISTHS